MQNVSMSPLNLGIGLGIGDLSEREKICLLSQAQRFLARRGIGGTEIADRLAKEGGPQEEHVPRVSFQDTNAIIDTVIARK